MSSTGARFAWESLDPAAPLDDLAPLLDIVGDARVVAVGESNHDVREFGLLRHRVARLLVERAGFDVVAIESGFADARALDPWVRGGPGVVADVATRGLGYRFGEAREVQDLLSWVRSRGDVTFAGLDVPGSAGNAEQAWSLAEDVLRDLDQDALPLLAEARQAMARYAAVHSGLAMGRYAGLDRAGRDAATAAVTELLTRLDGLAPTVPAPARDRYAVAAHAVRGAWRLDQFMRELLAVGAGHGRLASRDAHMAETVRWLLERHGPDARIVVLVHNGHLQRTPVAFEGMPHPMVPMGMHLAAELGTRYRPVAVTCGAGTTTGLSVDAAAPGGLWLHESPLPSPAVGSAEAWLADAGAAGADLRGLSEGPQSIRHADSFVPTPVVDAFDAVLQVPRVRPSDFVLAEGGLER
ncbi:erythromycin esterase family protein [Saccharopolyspora sp. NFXS83]|uniref:erythromycin esterase family protein n=1 Tax=Saccharopolyspora sp. NFXS83 TaxID=2993560 RepID=UPI00224B2B05|nr:erythromycin esterase family protein [Saccharopolyspora sp. NFXS83]MCX2732655.1 erythromycin esterase family protein [Saccharopolyspora sp. NFXS83]